MDRGDDGSQPARAVRARARVCVCVCKGGRWTITAAKDEYVVTRTRTRTQADATSLSTEHTDRNTPTHARTHAPPPPTPSPHVDTGTQWLRCGRPSTFSAGVRPSTTTVLLTARACSTTCGCLHSLRYQGTCATAGCVMWVWVFGRSALATLSCSRCTTMFCNALTGSIHAHTHTHTHTHSWQQPHVRMQTCTHRHV